MSSASAQTDQERANALVRTWLHKDHLYRRDIANAFAEELSAVRLEERRAIGALLRGIASTPLFYDEAAVTLLPRLADRIERGEHGS